MTEEGHNILMNKFMQEHIKNDGFIIPLVPSSQLSI